VAAPADAQPEIVDTPSEAMLAEIDAVAPVHGIAMHGAPKYGAEFGSLDYADPDAPKGGTLTQAVTGSFDSLNPFIVKGRTAALVRDYHFASLMARVWDEPFSLYGYVAQEIRLPEDRRWIAFEVHPDARFHDGTPITPDDVIFTVQALYQHGLPGFRRNYGRIATITRFGERGLRFDFTEEADRETPLIIALMPVISADYYTTVPIEETSLEIPLGAGPYRIVDVDPGRTIAYERIADWWAADLPVMRGLYNFDEVVFDYYRDQSVALEAFKSGAYTLRREWSADTWATGYDFPEVETGEATLATLPHDRPSGMNAFVFNSRRELFADRRVREALGLVFDFDWVNRNLLYSQYERIDSVFANSDLAPVGVPEGAERDLLEAHRGSVREEVFGEAYQPPSTEGGSIRRNLAAAADLLAEAGWTVEDGTLTRDGRPFAFEILLASAGNEKVALAWADNLRRLGIAVEVRTVDSAQYQGRIDTFDFDVILWHWRVTLSPGAEQNLYWGSDSASIEGSRNYAGIEDPVVDALIERVADARTRADLTAATRALDRVLMSGRWFVPLYYLDEDYWAWWGGMGFVDYDPVYGYVLESWWRE
ncbi:MAG: ABC transporter substrate-binding protein, partial [Deinococcus-Thermus bacterium]|nr:ABC transporter substrate-binding protein [Deinococcota bacterium]